MIEIIKEHPFSALHIHEAESLIEECNRYDTTEYIIDVTEESYIHNSLDTYLLYEHNQLISLISIFAPEKYEAELTAFTKPLYRKKGYFKTLLSEVEDDVRSKKYDSILFACDVKSMNGIEAIQHIHADYEFSEFLLTYGFKKEIDIPENQQIHIRETKKNDIDRLQSIFLDIYKNSRDSSIEITFLSEGPYRQFYTILYENSIVGMIGIYTETDRKYIYGFNIDPQYQGKGIGTYALHSIIRRCRENNDVKRIDIEVETKNSNALNLYKKAGFEEITEYKYFRKRLCN